MGGWAPTCSGGHRHGDLGREVGARELQLDGVAVVDDLDVGAVGQHGAVVEDCAGGRRQLRQVWGGAGGAGPQGEGSRGRSVAFRWRFWKFLGLRPAGCSKKSQKIQGCHPRPVGFPVFGASN